MNAIVERQARFIPVCSGNAMTDPTYLTPSSVYPRVLGERHPKYPHFQQDRGLSPCARGTLHLNGGDIRQGRFIPVCSGNAFKNWRITHLQSVYPRVLGERTTSSLYMQRPSGLSPCARGTRITINNVINHFRFIPVCSGNACECFDIRQSLSVYPRVLGERGTATATSLPYCGLSPCARGTRLVVIVAIFYPRFIPVCSGNALNVYYCSIKRNNLLKFLPTF